MLRVAAICSRIYRRGRVGSSAASGYAGSTHTYICKSSHGSPPSLGVARNVRQNVDHVVVAIRPSSFAASGIRIDQPHAGPQSTLG